MAYLYLKDMSSIADRVFAEVCLDERISDGVFRMDEEEHMNALRDYFLKKGITKEAAISVTNRMVEGKYPDRQAYRAEDGILVTWPSPKHKQKAMRENPGKYVEENPFPKSPAEKGREKRDSRLKTPPPEDKVKEPTPTPEDEPDEESRPASNLFNTGPEPKIRQGNKELSVEPVGGVKQPTAIQMPPPAPKTPETIAAEKELVNQIMQADDSVVANVTSPLNVSEECSRQLTELYKKAYEMGLTEAVSFLTKYVKP